MNTYNTYGAFALSRTFGNRIYEGDIQDVVGVARHIVILLFRIHNITFNILGYIPVISVFSGTTRISTGLLITTLSMISFCDSETNTKILYTGYSQIARGTLEAFIPNGRKINIILDLAGTIFNIRSIQSQESPTNTHLHYPSFFRILYLT
ncbi:MAG: hypothetical protein SP1CHLAM9_01010 [Chlamydiia bacterium]|nr:hypothetical protein [Chlamydiia bacterium]